MRRVSRPLLATFLLFSLTLLVPGWHTAAFDLVTRYTGRAELDGPYRLRLNVAPAVAMPGQLLTLDMELTNREGLSALPEVILELPAGLAIDRNQLPAGITLNLQTQALNWMPLPLVQGETRVITAQLRVEAADISQPDQQIRALVRFDGNELSAAADIWMGIPPRVEQILGPAQVAVGQPFQLRADVSGSGPMHQEWLIGDGRRVSVEDPVIVFPAPGIYEVSLELANPLMSVFATRSVTIVPHPAAQFTVDDSSPSVGQPVAFTSESGGLPPLSYLWDFGDGTAADWSSPSHIYQEPGSYQVHLIVQNDYGQSEAFWSVEVGTPPTADIIIPESVPSGVLVNGQAFGDESVTLFVWDMGDGKAYEGAEISHIYQRMGDYYVAVTASNEHGSSQVGRWIYVSQGLSSLYLPYISHHDLLVSQSSEDDLSDPFALVLEPVALDEPFTMEPLDLPINTSKADQLMIYINEARRLFELPPLASVAELGRAAQSHTTDMTTSRFAAHIGSDGSFPPERLLWNGYTRGYAGEATAWGFEHAYQAVEFWVNSPAHRRIILNRYATEVGVGHTVDYNAPNVWYWTAEFGTSGVRAGEPAIRLGQPAEDILPLPTDPAARRGLPLITDNIIYSWNWPVPLSQGQRFVLYLLVDGQARPLNIVAEPGQGTRFQAEAAAYPTALEYQGSPKAYAWQVKLLSQSGQVMAQSEPRTIILAPDSDLPAPTPLATPTPMATDTPSPTPSPTPDAPMPTPRPPEPTPPILVTATPAPGG